MSDRYWRLVALALLTSFPGGLIAQLPAGNLAMVLEQEVSAEVLDATGIEGATVLSDGSLAIGDGMELVVIVVAQNGLVRRFGRSGEGPGEFRNIREVASRGDTLWVADSRLQRFQAFRAADGRYLRAVRYEAMTELAPGTRLVVRPVAVSPQAMLIYHAASVSGGQVPGSGGARAAPVGAAGFVVAREGVPPHRGLAWTTEATRCNRVLEGRINFVRPFCTPAFLDATGDGHLVVIVEDIPTHTAEVRVRVQFGDLLSGRITRREVGYTPRRLTSADWDSVQARGASRLASSTPLRKAFDELPRDGHFPAFGAAVVLDEGMVVVRVFEPARRTARWLAIAPEGVVGMLELAPNEAPIAGRGGNLWVRHEADDGTFGLRRYRVGGLRR